ncbi:MAG TPA: 5-dehydro-2-deoxygluconokinase [Steroidobacteraceae bacterium]|nr:5-dehydro-2-deoxygluconokinase [Steroidobacteraceae bacterium]
MSASLDLVAIGRVSVDLYGQQIGSPLEDIATFAKAIGGCPANIAIGAARLGLRSALLTRVGDEPMGRFVLEQLAREGVDTRAVQVDAQRLTPLVLLAVRDRDSFPLVFYRENCADSVLGPENVPEELIASARAVLVTGTHFSLGPGAQAQRKAIALARAHGRKVILDIDYRPNLWGLGGHGAGASRYARSARVTGTLATVLPDCDLIVGTEEEMHIAAGSEDTLEAVRSIRARSHATLVVKRGAAGCVVFETGPPPRSLEEGLVAPGLAVEVYNVLGAGDAFLAGYLRGYLRDAPAAQCARYANACGALAVSRLLCSAEFPSFIELEYYLSHGSRERALRFDAALNHLHWVTTARRGPGEVRALATGVQGAQRAIEALAGAGTAVAGAGVLLDAAADPPLRRAALRQGLWVAQELAPGGASAHLIEWPGAMTVACRYAEGAEDGLAQVHAVCRAQGRELLVVIGGTAPPQAIARLYACGIRPDWWALAAPADPGVLETCAQAIAAGDAYCRGVLVLLEEAAEDAARRLAVAAASPVVRGFIATGSILSGVAERFRALTGAWQAAKEGH